MNSSFLDRGGWWVLGQSVLMTAVIVLGVVFQGDWARRSLILAGAILFIAGGVFGAAGVRALDTNRTPFPRPRDGSRLVTRGIYAWVRHPLYTSVMLASLGWAAIWQSAPSLLAALVLIPFFDAKSRREEHWLRERFPEYAGYERRTRRFIPRIY
jgi:protein-S-isoprenylcysteine O-methyltransferase Ste14